MLRKLFCLLTLVIFASNTCAGKDNNINLYDSIVQKGNFTVGMSFDSKPFGFKSSDGQAKGLEADLAREIAERLLGSKNKVIFKNVNSQDRIKATTSGNVDMVISTMTITPKRKKLVDFSVPYFIAGQAICVKKDSKINSLEDLVNKKIIVEIGTTGEQNIKRFAPNSLIQGYASNSEAMTAFKNGHGAALTTDDALLQSFVSANPDYMILPIKLTKEPYGIAFKKSKTTTSLRYKINDIIKDMANTGAIDRIRENWGIY